MSAGLSMYCFSLNFPQSFGSSKEAPLVVDGEQLNIVHLATHLPLRQICLQLIFIEQSLRNSESMICPIYFLCCSERMSRSISKAELYLCRHRPKHTQYHCSDWLPGMVPYSPLPIREVIMSCVCYNVLCERYNPSQNAPGHGK